MTSWQHTLNDITAALVFAKDYLRIKSDSFVWDWDVETRDGTRGYQGIYDSATRRMRFNGAPACNTIFHEAAHYQQHERGDDLIGGYARFARETETQLTGLPEDQIAWKAYWNCPWEIEAREKAREMAVTYRNRRAGLGAHWY